MEVTALCSTLLMNVLFLPCVFHQKVDSVFLRVVPNKLQFFEYESLSLHCEGFSDSTGWKIAHQFKKEACETTDEVTSAKTSCTLTNAYQQDSGEYWCEDGEGRRSNSINITVTDGPVILESPALPLKGETVTLSCRNKKTSSNLPADFYKDGFVFRRSSTGNMNILRVSECDEGLYKCSISGVGESAESWLTVRDPTKTVCSNSTPLIVCIVLLVILLLIAGLSHLIKDPRHRVMLFLSTLTSGRNENQTVSVDAGDEGAADAENVTYAVVRKNNKKKEPRVSSIRPAPVTGTKDCIYSTIQTAPK